MRGIGPCPMLLIRSRVNQLDVAETIPVMQPLIILYRFDRTNHVQRSRLFTMWEFSVTALEARWSGRCVVWSLSVTVRDLICFFHY